MEIGESFFGKKTWKISPWENLAPKIFSQVDHFTPTFGGHFLLNSK
jgi:hypothetical protein